MGTLCIELTPCSLKGVEELAKHWGQTSIDLNTSKDAEKKYDTFKMNLHSSKDEEGKEVKLTPSVDTLLTRLTKLRSMELKSWLVIPPNLWKEGGKIEEWSEEDYKNGRKDIHEELSKLQTYI
jgi:hypothetical protein